MISNNNKSTPEHPLVTIVALCYNQAKYAEETLDSILAQTYPNIQLIIMDDASTDNSVEVINSWIEKNQVDCKFIAHEENQGICKTLNEALNIVKGEYYQAIACDDVLLNHKIEKNIKTFDKLKNNETLIYSQAFIIDEKSRTKKKQYPDTFIPPNYDEYIPKMLNGNFISAPTCILVTKNIREIGGYDEDIIYEDYELWLRLLKNNHTFYYDNEPLVKYRQSDSQMSNAFRLENKFIIHDFKTQLKLFKDNPQHYSTIINNLTKTIVSLSFLKKKEAKEIIENCVKFSFNFKLFLLKVFLLYLNLHPKYIHYIYKKLIWS